MLTYFQTSEKQDPICWIWHWLRNCNTKCFIKLDKKKLNYTWLNQGKKIKHSLSYGLFF
jgi:hypothetical protein